MRILIILLLASLASAQVTAKHVAVLNTKLVEYAFEGNLISIDKIANGKTVKLTALDDEFTALAKGRPIATTKSVSAGIKELIKQAKATNTAVELDDGKGGKVKVDPNKLSKKSAYDQLLAAISAGAKKPKQTVGGGKGSQK